MKGRSLQNLSVNTAQLAANQLLGLGIFYFLSTQLNKTDFGRINLALAILLAVFNILSCGIDQLVVKKIAAGENAKSVLSLYIFHVLAAGGLFYGLIFAVYFLLPGPGPVYILLLLIGAGKLMLFFSTPFKQAANGVERFKTMAWMLVISNIVRCSGLAMLAATHWFSLRTVVLIFIAGDVAELICTIVLFAVFIKIPVTIGFNRPKYMNLLREALPQTGVVFITSALARFDWIFIGILVSAVKLAEYSFAYKVFEISSLPLLAVAPLLIPRFTKMFQQTAIPVAGLKLLVRIEMLVAAFTILIINVCWSPVIDSITRGKYGHVNAKTIFMLSLCLPFIYLNNFFWTMYFAQGRLKMIFRSFIVTLIINIAGDVILIPLLGNEGAALAFLVSCIAQTGYYYKQNKIGELNNCWQPLVISIACAVLCCFIPKMLIQNTSLIAIVSIGLYFLTLLITRQIRHSDKTELRELLR